MPKLDALTDLELSKLYTDHDPNGMISKMACELLELRKIARRVQSISTSITFSKFDLDNLKSHELREKYVDKKIQQSVYRIADALHENDFIQIEMSSKQFEIYYHLECKVLK